MPSTPAYSSATANAMQAAINKLSADYQSSPSNVALIQSDVTAYYQVQESVRGYASLAVSVVNDSDYNGDVADQSVERAFGDTSFGPNEAGIAAQLALQDWKQISAGVNVGAGGTIYVPTIVDDDQEHAAVFSTGGPGGSNILQYWSGSDFAEQNVSWLPPGSVFSYELQGASLQSASFPTMTLTQQAVALSNLTLSAGSSMSLTGLTWHGAVSSTVEFVQDASNFDNLLTTYTAMMGADVLQYGMNLAFPQAHGATLTVNAAQLDAATGSSGLSNLSNFQVQTTTSGTATQTINYANGTSIIRSLASASGTPIQTQYFSGQNGTGTLLQSASYSTTYAATSTIYGSVAPEDITGSNVALAKANLSFSAGGTGFSLSGQGTDTVWLGNNAQGAISGIGTIGVGQSDTVSASNANFVVDAGCGAVVTGTNDTAGIWGNNAGYTGSNATVTVASSLSGVYVTGGGNKVTLGASDTVAIGGSGNTISGQSTDSAFFGASSGGTLTGVGTVGVGSGDTLTTSSTTLVFQTGSNASVTGSGNKAQFYGSNASMTGSGSTDTIAANLTGVTISGQNNTLTVGSNSTVGIGGTGITEAQQSTSTTWLANNSSASISGGGTVGLGSADTLTTSSTTLVFQTGSNASVTGSGNKAQFYGSNASMTGSGSTDTIAANLTGVTISGQNNTLTVGSNSTVGIGGTGITEAQQSTSTTWLANNSSASISGGGTVGLGSADTLTTSSASLIFEAGSNASVTGSGNKAQFYGSNASMTGSGSTDTIAANLTGVTISGQNNALTVGSNSTVTVSGTGITVAQQSTSTTCLANNSSASVTGGGTVRVGSGDTLTSNSTSVSLGTGSTLTLNGSGNTVTACQRRSNSRPLRRSKTRPLMARLPSMRRGPIGPLLMLIRSS